MNPGPWIAYNISYLRASTFFFIKTCLILGHVFKNMSNFGSSEYIYVMIELLSSAFTSNSMLLCEYLVKLTG